MQFRMGLRGVVAALAAPAFIACASTRQNDAVSAAGTLDLPDYAASLNTSEVGMLQRTERQARRIDFDLYWCGLFAECSQLIYLVVAHGGQRVCMQIVEVCTSWTTHSQPFCWARCAASTRLRAFSFWIASDK